MTHRADAIVLTVGHSNHQLENLMALLRLHGVTAVADVRSSPYSRSNPQFNRESFREPLNLNGIAYVFLGHELGGRPKDQSCYVEGKLQYHRLAHSRLFSRGLDRIQRGVHSHRIALLCAEAEPLNCHRAILVAQELAMRGIPVAHIHTNGRLESHAEAMSRLVEMLGLSNRDLYRTKEEIIADACATQEKRIAYEDEGVSKKASV